MKGTRNLITPEFYSFIASNPEMYGEAIISQVNDAAEKISINEEQNESIAVCLSGYTTKANSKGTNLFANGVEYVEFSRDKVSRKKVRFRSIDQRFYNSNFGDFSSYLASPLLGTLTEEQMQYSISHHPVAYTLVAEFEEKNLAFGSIVVIKKIGDLFFIVENVSSPNMVVLNRDFGDGTRDQHGNGKPLVVGDHPLEKKWGLKRQTGNYTGILTQYHGVILQNGTLPKDMLEVPDTTYWEKWGSGDGSLLVDYIPSYNALCEAFFHHFKKKLRSSGIRSFKQQIHNRLDSVPQKNGGYATDLVEVTVKDPETKKKSKKMVPRACATIRQRGGGCGTAVPGRSNHGWGQAADIRIPEGHPTKGYKSARFIKKDDIFHKWLIENAHKEGFNGIKWAHLGQEGTPLSEQKYEAWHWEPITDRVIKPLD